MQSPLLLSLVVRVRRRGIPARLGSLVMLLQRSPLLRLLPEARVISTSGFSDAVKWTVMTVAGLGGFNSVSRATSVVQTFPVNRSDTVTITGGSFLNFVFQVVDAPLSTISSFEITGPLPAGLLHNDFKLPTQTRTNSISGTPVQIGSFPITITAWEFVTNTGRSVSANFTINVTAPPVPAISVQPQGGNFTSGSFVNLIATQSAGYNFVWKKDGQPLPNDSFILTSTAAPRRFLVPIADPGAIWRSGVIFNDSTWTPVSGGIGYDTNPNPVSYAPHIAAGGNVQTQMSGTGKPVSALIRIPFTMTAPGTISSLKLRVQCDDGFVAWLNGTEVAYQNRLDSLAFNSPAALTATDSAAILFREINISRFSNMLRTGENLLAIQAMNDINTSNDLLFNCELAGGIDATSTRRLILPAMRDSDAGSYTLTITNSTGSITSDPAVIVLPPTIETHPVSVSIQSGETARLTVKAVTSPPFTYQWFRGVSGDTANPVAGATGDSFTTPPLTASEKYWVLVSNPAGSVNSNAANVTVTALPPVISPQPESIIIDAGNTAQLTVGVSGAGPFSYQWYAGVSGDTAGLISGATNSTFTTSALTVTTSYWVRVSASGSADSNTAIVTVRDPFLTWQRDRFTPEELAAPEISGPAADPDGDGVSNDIEYIFGTQPKSGSPGPLLAMGTNGGMISLTFTAQKATGPGYAGRVRHYAIDTTNDVSAGPWTPLPHVADVIADDQTLTCIIPFGGTRIFCRLRIWLTP